MRITVLAGVSAAIPLAVLPPVPPAVPLAGGPAGPGPVAAGVSGTAPPTADAPLDDQGEGQGKICINVPVDTVAQAFARLVAQGLVLSPAAAAPGVVASTPPPQAAAAPGAAPAPRFLGGGLPKDMPLLEAVPC
ncbi:hypothetical protein [Nonomuraea diastatica]|uniref:Uncharacterized protein n=1 Tax=Nonomuraea diastatica TaxID=1848329 RepID=A0A4R4WDI2_9ACTN|nr:hypothetical protein [Nonomuraea diastatica]TDD11480.1 hypothetical protein E1294_45000 [Nonomuraea diastatica]